MRKQFIIFFLFIIACPLPLLSQEASHALFVTNAGQWEGNYDFKLSLSSGSIFFDPSGFTLNLLDKDVHGHNHDRDHHQISDLANEKISGHVIKLEYLNANPTTELQGGEKTSFYYNYLYGKDPNNWHSNVGVYRKIIYNDLYPGIDVRYFGNDEDLKYDFIVAPGVDPELIQMKYHGADQLVLNNKTLEIHTSIGTIFEHIPSVYQIVEGEKIEIKAKYKLKNGIVSIEVGNYFEDLELIIDPILVFSSFSGSSADNWGFTATYDYSGNTFAGGIIWNDGGIYPSSVGAYQSTFQGAQGDVDIGISKFSEQGNRLIFSTFIGGNGADIPQSLIVDELDNLYILGVTGSDNFPMPNISSYQNTFKGGQKPAHQAFNFDFGTDIFICKLNFDGQSIASSTYLGGTNNDGLNLNIYKNYGDDARGEIYFENGRVLIISNTLSTDIVLKNSYMSTNQGAQDMLLASFDADLATMNWGTYFGGSDDDAGYSVKCDSKNGVFIAGGTKSNDISGGSQSTLFPDQIGGLDGYLAKFDLQTGAFIDGTYLGTAADDQIFLLDIDKDDFVYTFGQSKGNIAITSGIYGQTNSQQFVKKLKNNLSTEVWSTALGSGLNKSDLVPTAFLVDDCYNIYMSGWNGSSNKIIVGGNALGNTNSLPVSTDAEQNTTDGSDFYFMVLDRDAQNLMYASYFGGTSSEHVDGGTSRFDPNGSIFQAICAGCGSGTFPTTPGAFARNNGTPNVNGVSRCNLGVVKFDFEITVRSKPEIDLKVDIDTVCDSLFVTFQNESVNADIYEWDFGNGTISNLAEPKTVFGTLGNYAIRLVASDTNCGISDTSFITLNHAGGSLVEAFFDAKYQSCDTEFNSSFFNSSNGTHLYQWDFGDGNSSFSESPSHQFKDYGSYIVTLTAFDSICFKFSTFTDTIVFEDTTTTPSPIAAIAQCGDGSLDIKLENDKKRFIYKWDFGTDGKTSSEKIPLFYYSEPGNYTIKLKIIDPECNKEYNLDYPVIIENIGREMFIPNSFSPNGDGLNEVFEIFGNHCGVDDEIRIFNRWGKLVFQTNKPFEEFWDAQGEEQQAPIGVYTYSIRNGDKVYKGSLTLFR